MNSHPLDISTTLSNNSTIDHAYALKIPAYIRLPFQLASRLSPPLGGELGRRIFFFPPRRALKQEEHAILSQSQRGSLTVHGREVFTYSWGEGEGPAVLLVHGWGGHAGQMTSFVNPLLAQGFRVIALDLPGHGKSGGRLSSLVHFRTAILAVCDSLGTIHGAVSHSLGAAGLIQALLCGLSVERVVLVAPQAQFHDIWSMFRRGLGMNNEVWAEMVRVSERWLGIPFAEVHPAVGAPHMTAPALILHGQLDRMTPVSEGRLLAGLWPRVQLKEFDLGHQSILKDSDAINAATAFLAA